MARSARRVPRPRAALALLVAMGLSVDPAHAIFSGVDEFDVTDLDTEAEIDSTYFLDLLSYEFRPDWRERWLDRDWGYRVTGGSLGSDEFFLFQQGKIHARISDDLTARWDVVQLADLDREHEHQTIELEARLPGTEHLFVAFGGEVQFLKEDADLAFGLAYRRGPWRFLRVTGTLVDFVFSEKNVNGNRDERVPYHVEGDGAWTGDGWRLRLRAAWDTPLERVLGRRGFEFRHERLLGEAEGLVDLGPEMQLGVRLGFERTRRATFLLEEPAEPPGEDEVSDARFRRSFTHGRVFLRHGTPDIAWDAGLQALYRRTETDDALRPERTNERERFEVDPYVEAGLPITDGVTLDLGYYLGIVSRDARFPDDAERSRSRFETQHKGVVALELVYPPLARLLLNVTVDLDQFGTSSTFDGGNVQFMMGF